MARSGINKTLVKKARDAVLSKGENPSIDRVRIELGNTGSKATIHRYLKELEIEESTQLNDEALLSNTLKEIVARLASRLYEEAESIVSEAKEQVKKERSEWLARNEQQAKEIIDLQQHLTETKQHLDDTTRQSILSKEAQQAAVIQVERLHQEVTGLKNILMEKDLHTQSLEDKHQHYRETLEHYRESVKTQREQDQRRHDQQLQQLHVEQRQLNQTLSLKQADITQLNRDNARLAAEMTDAHKLARTSELKIKKLELQLTEALETANSVSGKLKTHAEMTKGQASSLEAMRLKLSKSKEEKRLLETELSRLEIELDVKNQLYEKAGIIG